MRLSGWLALGLVACAQPAAAGSDRGLTRADLELLVRAAERWVADLRAEHRPFARPLTTAEQRSLGPFFPPSVMERARIRRVAAIPNPELYRFFRERGEPEPIDFTRMSALSLGDTVLVVESRVAPRGPGWRALLFHELVHNTQDELLADRYMEAYVRGWAESGAYRTIPIEAQAYSLAARFRSDPERAFSVAEEVRALARALQREEKE